MDRHRPDRGGDGRFSRIPSRWSDGPLEQRQPFQPPGGGGEGFSGGRHHPYGGGPREFGSRSPGFRQGYGGFGEQQVGIGGPRHGGGGGGGGGFFGAGRGTSPGGNEGTKFAKLFIGSVPRTATEEDIRPLFEEHGHVMEVALIKDKRTGQQQGCCFIKYANSEEADRAIRSLHNQYTLPGGMGPIQVRYADGERERLGAVEHKLFVGSLNKLATEKEVEEIFSPYGRVEDVYIMRDELKQSRGCGFVKFSNREMATAAINALNGVFVMRGCEQPLIVRFADPKRPRPGESRGGPAFGGPGFGPRSQAPPGPRSMSNADEPISGRFPPKTWRSPESLAQPSHGFSDIHPKGGPTTSTGYNSTTQVPPIGQQISPMQKATLSPQNFPLQMHHNQQAAMPYSQIQASQAPVQQLSQVQNPHSGGLPSFNRALSSQQFVGSGGQLSSSQPLLHQGGSSTLQLPLNMQHAVSGQQQVPSSAMSQLHQQTVQQSPAQGQMLPQHQAQSLQSNFQSPQQSFSQMQQQLQSMQVPNLNQQQIPQTLKHQPSNHASVPSSTSSAQLNGQITTPLPCSWTEHTSPEGFKYYYNSATKESKWEKPEELSLFEQQQKLQQQQQQQKVANQQQQSQPQMPLQTQVQPQHQVSQMQPAQAQMQLRQQAQFQQLPPSLQYQNPGAVGHQNIQDLGYSQFQGTGSSADLARVQKGLQSAQEWMWKNKPAGT